MCASASDRSDLSRVLITGASRGVGRAAALKLAETGRFRKFILVCRSRREALAETAAEITRITEETLPVSPLPEICTAVGDAGDHDFTQKIRSDFGAADVLVNCAAISRIGLLTDMEPAEWDEILRSNLTSVYNICHVFLPDMIRTHRGKILNISSVWGLAGASCEVAYSATKGAVNAFTKALGKELAPSGIQVNALALGCVDTEMNDHLSPAEKADLTEEIPAGRMASAREAGEAVLKILEMPDYFTGEVVKFDGGWI